MSCCSLQQMELVLASAGGGFEQIYISLKDGMGHRLYHDCSHQKRDPRGFGMANNHLGMD